MKFLKYFSVLILALFFVGWGPNQHQRIMRDIVDGLKKTEAHNFAKFIESADQVKYSSYPDLNLPSHGWDMVKDRGNIISYFQKYYLKLVKELQRPVLDKKQILIDAGCIQHYIADLHTIGQISSEFWGRPDDKIDLASEFCSFSPIYKGGLGYIGLDSLKKDLHFEIGDTYIHWRWLGEKAKRLWFVNPGMVKPYVDRQGAWSVYYGKLALWNAWIDAGKITDFSHVKRQPRKRKHCIWWKHLFGLC